MIALLFAAVCGWSDTPCCTALPEPHAYTACAIPDAQPLKALRQWLKRYRKGKLDYRSRQPIGKDSLAIKYDIVDKNALGHRTWSGDLVAILAAISERDDAEAARALAEVAAIGLDDVEYTYAMAPYDVRSAGLDAIAKLTSDAAKSELAAGARGEWKANRKQANALRASAMMALGKLGAIEHREVLVAGLADGDEIVRIHAIQALASIGDEDAQKALIGMVEREASPAALIAATKALRTIYAAYFRELDAKKQAKEETDAKKGVLQSDDEEGDNNKPAADPQDPAKLPAAPKTARLAVRAAIKALGRTNWRADMVLTRLLGDFRSAEAVPALIAALERFRDNQDDIKSGKSSALLKFQVHELLVSMTGAVFSADQPEKWRELWDREKDNLKVAEKRDTKGTPKTSAAGFAGIPVEGTRVVFILDLSGSMQAPMDSGGGQQMMRIDYAKRELMSAIDGLAENAYFNLVTFNGEPKADRWSKKMVIANKRNKDRLRKEVSKLRPMGGTNLWGGIAKGLSIKSLVFGNHYETTVDEVFILSDGAPTAGEVIDPVEILRLVQEANRFQEVRINTVFISSATPPGMMPPPGQRPTLTPKELMRRMAKENGGKFRDV